MSDGWTTTWNVCCSHFKSSKADGFMLKTEKFHRKVNKWLWGGGGGGGAGGGGGNVKIFTSEDKDQ